MNTVQILLSCSCWYCETGLETNITIEVDDDDDNEGYPVITYTMHLSRKPLYYVVNLIIPCCLLSFLAVSSFLLQPNCADRLGLSTFVFFLFLQIMKVV